MSETVDKRIVEMEFDNAQFKKGVAETIASIKDLDNSLDLKNGAKSLDAVSKAIDNINVSNLVDSVGQAGGALNDLKSTAISVASAVGGVMKGSLWTGGILSAVSAIPSIAQSLKGGMNRAAKLAQAEFQFKGLHVEGEELQKLLQRVSESVTDTAYGLDDATSVASMLYASGIKDVKQLGNALDNISNVAATFNADYQSIADVMAKVASKGKMQGEEFQQLAHKGMNAKAVIAEFLQTEEGMAKYGGLIEQFGNTEAAVDEMSKKGVISFELLNDALSLFAGNAKRSNDTLSGITANIKAALGRSTADFFQYTLHNVDGVIKVLKDVKSFINNANKVMSDFMSVVKDPDTGEILKYGTAIQGVLDILEQVHRAIDHINTYKPSDSDGLSTYFHSWHTLVQEIDPLLQGFFNRVASITYHLTKFLMRTTAIVREAIRIIVRIVKPIATAFDEVFGQRLVDFVYQLDRGFTEFMHTLYRLRPSEATMDILYKAFSALFNILAPFVDFINGAFIAAFEVVAIVFDAVMIVVEALIQVFDGFLKLISPAINSIGELFGIAKNGVDGVGDMFLSFLDNIRLHLQDASDVVRKLSHWLEPLFENIAQGVDDVNRALRESGIAQIIEKTINNVKIILHSIFDNAESYFNKFVEFVKPIADAILDTFGKIGQAVSDFFSNNIINGLTEVLGVGKAFADTGMEAALGSEGLRSFADGAWQVATAIRDGLLSFGGIAVESFGKLASSVWGVVGPAIEHLWNLILKIKDIVVDAFQSSGISWDPFIQLFQKLSDLLNQFLGTFENGGPKLSDFKNLVDGIGIAFADLITNIGPKFTQFIEQIGNDIFDLVVGNGPIGSMIKGIGDAVGNINQIPEAIENIPKSAEDNLPDFVKLLGKAIRNPFAPEKAWADDGTGGETAQQFEEQAFNVVDIITAVKDKLNNPLVAIKKFFTGTFTDVMTNIGEGIHNGIEAIDLNAVALFIQSARDVIISFSSLWGTITAVSVLESIREISFEMRDWASHITGFLKNVEAVPAAFKNVFDTISKSIKTITTQVSKDMKANRFLKYVLGFVAVIGVMTASIYILSRLSEEELIRAGLTMLGMVGLLLAYQALMRVIAMIPGENGDVASLAGLVGMGFAITMITRAVKMITEMDQSKVKDGVESIVYLMTVLGAMASVVGRTAQFGLQGAALILSIGIALRFMMGTIAMFSTFPWGAFIDGGVKALLVMAALTGMAVAVGKLSGEFYKAGAALLAMSASLVIVAVAIGLLNLVTGGDSEQAALLMLPFVLALVAMATALGTLSGFTGSILKAALAIDMIAGCLIAVSVAIGILNLVTMGDPKQALALGVILAGMLYVMGITLQKIGNQTRQLSQATQAMFIMAICIGAIGGAITMLSLVASHDPVGMIVGTIAFLLALNVMAASLIAIGKNSARIEAATPAIWNMVLAIAAIGAAISAIMLISGGDIAKIAVAAGSLVLAMVVMAGALVILGKSAAEAVLAAPAMLELSAAMLVLAVAIGLLGTMEIPQLVQGFIALIGAVVLLGVAAIAVSTLSGAFAIFDGVLIGLGLGLVAISAAFYMFVLAVSDLAKVAPEAFRKIAESADDIIAAFGVMGKAVAVGLMSFFATMAEGVMNGLQHVGDTIAQNSAKIGNAASQLGQALVTGIINGLGGLVVGVGSAIEQGITGAINLVGGIITGGGESIAQDMSEEMANHPADYQNAGEEAVGQFTDGVSNSNAPQEAGGDIVAGIDAGAKEAAENTDSSEIVNSLLGDMDLPEGVADQFTDMFSTEQFDNLGLDLGSVVPGNVVSGVATNPINPQELLSGMNLTPESYESDVKGFGMDIGSMIPGGIGDGMKDTSSVDSGVSTQLDAIKNRGNDYNAGGVDNATAYVTGVSNMIVNADMSPAIVANTAKLASAIEPAKTTGDNVGKVFDTSEMTGMATLASAVGKAAKEVTKSAASDADGDGHGRSVGSNFAQGMANGISSGTSAVAQAARDLVDAALEAAADEADEQSPSKKTRKQGRYFAEGYGLGIRAMSAWVADQSSNMVTMAMDEAKESFGVMDELLDVIDWDSQPTITPVLDLSEYNAGLAQVSDLEVGTQVSRIGMVNRVGSPTAGDSAQKNQNGGNHIEVHLDWHAGVTANQMAVALTQAIEMQNLTEGSNG